jgi:hypothetical protein
MRTDVVDQTLAIAMHPSYDCKTAIVSASMILCLAQSPGAHAYIAKKEVIESMLKICELKQKMVSEQQSSGSFQGEKEDPMAVNALKYDHNIILFLSNSFAHKQHSHLSSSLSLSLSLSLSHTSLHYYHSFFFHSGAILVLYWLKLDLVHHISLFHIIFSLKFSI